MSAASPHRGAVEVFFLATMALLLGVMTAPRAGVAAPTPGQNPRAYCARAGNDDTLRRPPRALGAAIARLFDIKGSYGLATTYYRCAGGAVLLCNVGANLPCGKANTAKTLAAATQWCDMHPNSDFIPMAVTGHDTLYSWRCIGHAAHAGAAVGKLDGRGFFAEYWKKL
jgi:hypothetical protein